MQNPTLHHEGHSLAVAAERQMRNWALELETRQRLDEEYAHQTVSQLIHPYVAISREAGVDAADLAASVAKECGWAVLGRELLDYLAEHEHMSRMALEIVDERAASWFHEVFGKWLESHLVSQAEYVSRLGRLVLLAAQHESVVFVGRGVQFMLPRDRGLAVRIIAPLKQRVEAMMRRQNCAEREAKRLVAESDDHRARFIHRYFHKDVADPHLYDLVINLEHISRGDAVELLANEVRHHVAQVRDRAH
ncbi:MAG: cytidylate kinase-like family protein [Pirellulales bacterium]|nr:cytidylate kinase-like family protein [Pirellulales bacterium]